MRTGRSWATVFVLLAAWGTAKRCVGQGTAETEPQPSPTEVLLSSEEQVAEVRKILIGLEQRGLTNRRVSTLLRKFRPTDADVTEGLVVGLLRQPTRRFQAEIRGYLASLGSLAAPCLTDLLSGEDDALRWEALLTLTEMGPPARPAVNRLTELLRDERPEIRRQAAIAVARIGDPPPATVDELMRMLGDFDRDVRLAAIHALGHSSSAEAAAAMIGFIAQEAVEPLERQSAIAALRRLSPAEAEKLHGPLYDATAAALADIGSLAVGPGDWPQWGGSRLRNNTPTGENIPTDWDVGKLDRATGTWSGQRNIKWAAPLGSQTYGNPVVANGRVYIGTNNGGGYLARYPATVDLGVLLCLDEQTGHFLWQHSSEKLPTGRVHDWPLQGVCSTPVVDGDRLWFVTNRCEVLCLDSAGFHDGENDGPCRDEPFQHADEADVIWRLDMRGQLGVSPHNMSTCCPIVVGERLFVCTSNGVDEGHENLPAPEAPSFIALDRATGEVLWTDNSPGAFVLHGQWASPSYAVFDGQPQVLFPGGDGWLYSFDSAGDGQGGSRLLWKFDGNPKRGRYNISGRSTRNHMIAMASIYDGLVYIAMGEDPEHGEGAGDLWCIDPGSRGDVSAELVFNVADPETPIGRKRLLACVEEDGDFTRPNPNSAMVWHRSGHDTDGDQKISFEEQFRRSLGIPVIKDDILYTADFSGLFHCLDARTGRPHWTYDIKASCWGSPVLVDDKVYIGDEDGDVAIFRHSNIRQVAMPDGRPLAEIELGNAINGSPIVANGVLYFATRTHLLAIAEAESTDEQ